MTEHTPPPEPNITRAPLIISILTLILTPIFSGLVVSYQLNKQHDIWGLQRKFIIEEKLIEKKFERAENTGEVISQLLQKAKLANIAVENLVKLGAYEKSAKKTLKYKKIFELGFKYSEAYEMLESQLIHEINTNNFFFSDGVNQLGKGLISNLHTLKPLTSPVKTLKSLKTAIDEIKEEEKSKEDFVYKLMDKKILKVDYEPFSELAKNLLESMYQEIKNSKKS